MIISSCRSGEKLRVLFCKHDHKLMAYCFDDEYHDDDKARHGQFTKCKNWFFYYYLRKSKTSSRIDKYKDQVSCQINKMDGWMTGAVQCSMLTILYIIIIIHKNIKQKYDHHEFSKKRYQFSKSKIMCSNQQKWWSSEQYACYYPILLFNWGNIQMHTKVIMQQRNKI